MKKKYSTGNLTVFWDSDKCILSRNCDGQLPQVFNPTRRPWINLEAADVETIKRVIDTCPSGALTYEVPGEKKPEAVTIKIIRNGPYRVSGKCCLVKENCEVIETGEVCALCRCGSSKKMPFCDGSHQRTGFHDGE